MSSRQGQMEIIGLVVIVILITLGMLLMAIFALRDKPTSNFFDKQVLAYSAMSSLMRTSVHEQDCSIGTIGAGYPQIGKDLIDDCAQYADDQTRSGFSCAGKHSCVYVHDIASELLSSTLGRWKISYELDVRLQQHDGTKKQIIEHVGSERSCRGAREVKSSYFPLQTETGLIESVLKVC